MLKKYAYISTLCAIECYAYVSDTDGDACKV
jgi:hypothetical protein